jgi:tetratricopeptide (TPR) repeat protein
MDADPNWAPVHLVSAQSRLLVGNLGGAIEDIEKVAFLDKFQDRRQSPLQEVWVPPVDWRPLRKALESELAQDARFAARGPAAVAVVAWYADHSDSRRLLDRALEAGAEVPGAYAARAQDLLAAGDFKGAYRHAEQVLSSGHDLTLLYALKGRSLAALGRPAEANAEFRKATDEPHGLAVVQRLIAETRAAEGRTEDARAAWTEVLKLVPDDLPARAALLDLRRAGQ